MTSTPTAAEPEAPARRERSGNWGDHAVHIAGVIASDGFKRGDLAALRRMDTESPDPAAFWRLLAEQGLLDSLSPAVEKKWGLILHGIALMTRTAGTELQSRSAHNGDISVGQALFRGGEGNRRTVFYSELRLNRLLNAREGMLKVLLARMFRMAASARVTFNWREMAQFILTEGYDEERAEVMRHRIAKDYYQAERRQAQTDNEGA